MVARRRNAMQRQIPEADWKLLRRLAPVALDRFCQRALAEVVRLTADGTKSNHERYLAVYRLIEERDEKLSSAFNDSRRSTAFVHLARIRSFGLLTDDEFAAFSDETQAAVAMFLEMWGS